MSTPFIHMRKRQRDLTFELSLVVPSCLMALSLFVAGVVGSTYFWEISGVSTVAAQGMWTAQQLYVYGPDQEHLQWGSTQESKSRRRTAESREAALIRSIVVPPSGRVPTLVVRVAGDEASGLLSLARFVAWISTFGLPAVRIIPALSGYLVGIVAFAFVGWRLASASCSAESSWFGCVFGSAMLSAIPVLFATVAGMTALLVTTGLLALPVLLGFTLLPVYGIDVARLFTRYEFSVEETPVGQHLVEQLSFVTAASLLHSAAYNHEGVSDVVRQWLTSTQRWPV
jgi:hypothetical protein